MNYPNPLANVQPEHLEIAVKMANELLSRFCLDEQNEAIALVCQRVREARINETHELQMRIETIQKSLGGIPLPTIEQAKESRY